MHSQKHGGFVSRHSGPASCRFWSCTILFQILLYVLTYPSPTVLHSSRIQLKCSFFMLLYVYSSRSSWVHCITFRRPASFAALLGLGLRDSFGVLFVDRSEPGCCLLVLWLATSASNGGPSFVSSWALRRGNTFPSGRVTKP